MLGFNMLLIDIKGLNDTAAYKLTSFWRPSWIGRNYCNVHCNINYTTSWLPLIDRPYFFSDSSYLPTQINYDFGR